MAGSMSGCLQKVRDVVRSRHSRGDGGESGSEISADSAHTATRPSLKERGSRLLTRGQWTAAAAILVVLLWMSGSIAFAYLYDYLPFDTFETPGSIPRLPSTCEVNQTCIFTMGGSIASYHKFLPAVEAFNGSHWGSEAMLPATCPDHTPGKATPDCGDEGTYGRGVTSNAVVFGERIYLIGHDRYGAMYSYSGNKELVTDKLGKTVKQTFWPEHSMLNKRREGFAVVVYRGRIFAIGGKTTCIVVPKSENPESRCTTNGHLTRTDQGTEDRSTTVESIDPVNEMTWRVDCYGGGEEDGGEGTAALCTQQERSGACAAVHQDKVFLIGGNDGSVVEFFDGEKWEELETKFPAVIYGASAISFGGKLWVIGGSSFNKYQASVVSWDGNLWFKATPLTHARAYPAVVAWRVCKDASGALVPLEASGVVASGAQASTCQEAVFVLGGSNGSSAIPEVEVATFGMQTWDILPQLLPTQRNRLGAVLFAKLPPEKGKQWALR